MKHGARSRWTACLIGLCWLLVSNSALAQRPDEELVFDQFVRLMSPEIDELLFDRQSYRVRLSTLPDFTIQPSTRAGFHSLYAKSSLEPQWVQIDLGRLYEVGSVVLVPVSTEDGQLGYGFPLRFRVQISDDPEFHQASLLADQTSADVINPGRYPMQFTGLSARGRYVRLTCTKLPVTGLSPFFALGELMVISDERNVAAWRPVTASAPLEIESRWARQYLVDEISILPLPTSREASRTNGYLSLPSESAEVEKWLQLDLGQVREIDEVRLIPARPHNQPDIPGWGVPESFRIDLANQADFSDAVPLCDFSQVRMKHASNHALVFPSELREMFSTGKFTMWDARRNPFPSAPIKARYVRLTTSVLDSRIFPRHLALAEMQVLSGSENVALKAKVTALDVAGSEFERWSPLFAVDDFASGRRLLGVSEWLNQVERRRNYEERMDLTDQRLRLAISRFWYRAKVTAALLVALISSTAAFVLWRQQRRLQVQTERLRNQISSDLHDDIGSNLGTIALLCQTCEAPAVLSPSLFAGIQEIRTIALETGDAMRDILWLMRGSKTTLGDFIGRMRTITTRMTPGFEVDFTSPDPVPVFEVNLVWRRNVFLSFKEALYNAVRHSKATKLTITVSVSRRQFEIQVADNGTGMINKPTDGGYGMGNLSRRLGLLGGTVDVASTVGAGTTITLRAPLAKISWRLLQRATGG